MPYIINDEDTFITPEPVTRNDIHFVPARQILEAIGGTVTWSDDGKMATTTLGMRIAMIKMDLGTVMVNMEQTELPASPFVEDGMLWVPWQYFRDALNMKANMVGEKFFLYTG